MVTTRAYNSSQAFILQHTLFDLTTGQLGARSPLSMYLNVSEFQ